MEALRQYRHLPIEKHSVLHTDHFSLTTFLMMQSKTPQESIPRWFDPLAKYDITIQHIKGVQNAAPDALSRFNLAAIPTLYYHR